MPLTVSVVLPTHAPHPGRLQRTLEGLRAQTLPLSEWETIVVDNASSPPLQAADLRGSGPDNLRVVRAESLGLTHARRAGIGAAQAAVIVLVDDDNVLAPNYLAEVLALFASYPQVGALGGRSVPEFEVTPPSWVREFDGLIACRDLGPAARISAGLRPAGSDHNVYPEFAPIGAGMALRRDALAAWLTDSSAGRPTDRRGSELTSGGDNDMVLTVMEAGWEVAYFPTLSLTHLIPAARIDPAYLGRLNRGIAKSWIQVLAAHDACPWAAIPRWSLAPRQAKAWLSRRAWTSPAARIRWQGACGHFEGLAALTPRHPKGARA